MSDNLKKSIRKASTANSLILILFIVIVLGASLLTNLLNTTSSFSLHMYQLQCLILYIFQYAIIIPLLLILFRRTKHGKAAPRLRYCFCKPKMPASQIVKWIFISLFVIYLSSYISIFLFNIIQDLTGIELNAITVNTDASLLNRLTNILAIMFLAPIFEEILFRGTMLRNAARYGSWSMIISVGIMFGLWHLNYAQTIYTAVLGICTGFLIIKSGSIIPSMLLHFIMNTIGTAQSLLAGELDPLKLASGDIDYMMENITPIMATMCMGLLLIGIMITGLVLLIIELAKHKLSGFRLPCEYTEVSEKKKFVIYFSSPITIIVTLCLIGLTIYRALL